MLRLVVLQGQDYFIDALEDLELIDLHKFIAFTDLVVTATSFKLGRELQELEDQGWKSDSHSLSSSLDEDLFELQQ